MTMHHNIDSENENKTVNQFQHKIRGERGKRSRKV